jgi:hypothetical protein
MNEKEIETELDLESRKWKHRRVIAFRSMIIAAVLLIFTVIGAAVDDQISTRLSAISDVIVWGIVSFCSLTGAYMGLSTWQENKKR